MRPEAAGRVFRVIISATDPKPPFEFFQCIFKLRNRIQELNSEFRSAILKWLGLLLAGAFVIAFVLGWGREPWELFLIFVGLALLFIFLSLIANVIPSYVKHAALLEEYGDEYLDLALGAVENLGLIEMLNTYWFHSVAERELKGKT